MTLTDIIRFSLSVAGGYLLLVSLRMLWRSGVGLYWRAVRAKIVRRTQTMVRESQRVIRMGDICVIHKPTGTAYILENITYTRLTYSHD